MPMILVEMREGRPVEQKRRIAHELADASLAGRNRNSS
jgi:phenylpyruvate tautomerase PptA (4-oxalocrotonate tautomerase family)